VDRFKQVAFAGAVYAGKHDDPGGEADVQPLVVAKVAQHKALEPHLSIIVWPMARSRERSGRETRARIRGVNCILPFTLSTLCGIAALRAHPVFLQAGYHKCIKYWIDQAQQAK